VDRARLPDSQDRQDGLRDLRQEDRDPVDAEFPESIRDPVRFVPEFGERVRLRVAGFVDPDEPITARGRVTVAGLVSHVQCRPGVPVVPRQDVFPLEGIDGFLVSGK
jgi:hypothetical protein